MSRINSFFSKLTKRLPLPGSITPVLLRGRVSIKETGQPLKDVLVEVYWVNQEALGNRFRSWYDHLKDNRLVKLAQQGVTLSDGRFNMALNERESLGSSPVICFLVWPSVDEANKEIQKPLHKSLNPINVNPDTTFKIEISRGELEASAFTLPPLVDLTFLDRGEEMKKDVASWLKKDRQERDEKINIVRDRTKKAFSNFHPSLVPKSLQKQSNYLIEPEKMKDEELAEILSEVRQKAFDQIKDSVKKRWVTMTENEIRQLKWSKENEASLPFGEAADLLSPGDRSLAGALDGAIADVKVRLSDKQSTVEKLYELHIYLNTEGDS